MSNLLVNLFNTTNEFVTINNKQDSPAYKTHSQQININKRYNQCDKNKE